MSLPSLPPSLLTRFPSLPSPRSRLAGQSKCPTTKWPKDSVKGVETHCALECDQYLGLTRLARETNQSSKPALASVVHSFFFCLCYQIFYLSLSFSFQLSGSRV